MTEPEGSPRCGFPRFRKWTLQGPFRPLAGRIHLSFTMILPTRTRCRMLPDAFATGDPKQGSRHRVTARKVGSGWVANRPHSKGCAAERV